MLLLLLLLLLDAVACALGRQGDSFVSSGGEEDDDINCSVVVYGATAAGVTAAVAAAREMGSSSSSSSNQRQQQSSRRRASPCLIGDRGNVGGMTTGGLGKTDVGISAAIGGQAAAFYEAMGVYYNLSLPIMNRPLLNVQPQPCRPNLQPCRYYGFEPSVAEAYLRKQLSTAGVRLFLRQHVTGVEMTTTNSAPLHAPSIVSLLTNTSQRFRGTVFVDATYEGDLLLYANVSHRWGREAAAEFNETLAGVYPSFSKCNCDVSPWADAHNKTLITSLQPGPLGKAGEADAKIQAYDFRVTLTNDSANKIPIARPADYEPAQFEYLRRLHARHGWNASPGLGLTGGRWCLMPTGKGNTGGFSKTDLNGEDLTGPSFAWAYPNASWQERHVVWERYVSYIRGHLYFLTSDPAINASIRDRVKRWGWPKDEFKQSGGFPHQLYVREARRMVGATVLSQRDVATGHDLTKQESVGLGSYDYDSHYAQRVPCSCGEGADTFFGVQDEGGIPHEGRNMFQIPRNAIVPQKNECSNLIVPVCLSATHIGLSAIRLEPTYMILGESAGILAALSAVRGLSVQAVPYSELRLKLVAAKQTIDAPPPPPPKPRPVYACIQSWRRCVQLDPSKKQPPAGWPNATFSNSSCGGHCIPLASAEWLANAGEFSLETEEPGGNTSLVVSPKGSWLKKSEVNSGDLPASEKLKAPARRRIAIESGSTRAGSYYLIRCAQGLSCGLQISRDRPATHKGALWWDGTFCDT
jgi:hypothetical protein